MDNKLKQPHPKRGIIAATREFYEKWLASHKAQGASNPEAHYAIIKLYESQKQ